MYYYIYDEHTQDKRYEKEVLAIENRLTDLGISGKVARLALFRNAEEMIRDEIRRGVQTVVVVGNDATVRKVINVVVETGVTFGILPVGFPNMVATLMGVPKGEEACDVLSARHVETIDTGSVNGRRFIGGISMPKFQAELTCDGTFRLTPKHEGALQIRNLVVGETWHQDEIANPTDGKLEAVIEVEVASGWGILKRKKVCKTVIPFETLAIRCEEPSTLFVDGEELTANRFDIDVESGTLKMITGRGRMF